MKSFKPILYRFMLMGSLLCAGGLTLAQPSATPSAPPTAEPVRQLVPRVISVHPHDTAAYTQGLVLHEGVLYESAGLYGQSSLRAADPETGEVQRRVEGPPEYFAEGLALVDDRLIQLTWRENTAFVYDRETFEIIGSFSYEGEGWGLCYDGEALIMSDGTPVLTFRDPETFAALDTVTVTLIGQPLSRYQADGGPVSQLNELECVGDSVYANAYMTDVIFRIDKTTGAVTGVIFAQDLLTPDERAALAYGEVLNGIAYDAANDTFLLTGKNWPKLFVVRFVPPA